MIFIWKYCIQWPDCRLSWINDAYCAMHSQCHHWYTPICNGTKVSPVSCKIRKNSKIFPLKNSSTPAIKLSFTYCLLGILLLRPNWIVSFHFIQLNLKSLPKFSFKRKVFFITIGKSEILSVSLNPVETYKITKFQQTPENDNFILNERSSLKI